MEKLSKMTVGTLVKNEWWCISRTFDGLYKMNLYNKSIECVCKMPEKNQPDKQAYIDILSLDDELYFIPAFAKNIAVYNITTKLMKQIDISDLSKEGEFSFAGACVYNNWLLLYPCFSTKFVRINLKTLQIDVNDTFIIDNELNKGNFAFHKRHFQEKKIIYIAIACEDAVVCVDIENFSFKMLKIDNNQTGYSAITKSGDDLWLAPTGNGNIVKYKMTNGKTKFLGEYPNGFKRSEGVSFSGFFDISDTKVGLAPFAANMFLCIDKNSGEITKYIINFKKKWLLSVMEDIRIINVHSVQKCGGKFYISSESLNRLLIIDKDGKVFEREYTTMLREKDIIVVNESAGFDLKEYIDYMINMR